MSKAMTVLAPRSNNISTNRAPTRPDEPVTKAVQPLGDSKPAANGGGATDVPVAEDGDDIVSCFQHMKNGIYEKDDDREDTKL